MLQFLIAILLDKWTSLFCDGNFFDGDIEAVFFHSCWSHDFVLEKWIGVKLKIRSEKMTRL
jgi:hypothetical protein